MVNGAVVVVKGSGAEVCWFYCLADEMCFADPGSLLVREDDGDFVACFLESVHEGVDVWGGLV